MAKLRSIFGDINSSPRLQFLIDSRADKFKDPFYKKYFTFGVPQLSLSYTSVLGASAIETAASVVSRDAETPLRGRNALSKLYGEVSAIKVMRKLNESHYRDYMSLQDLSNVSDALKKEQALKLIWDDVSYVANSVDRRLDYFVAEGLSSGEITLTVENNPDGIVSTKVDLFAGDTSNKVEVGTAWSDAANATPIKDMLSVVSNGEMKGVTFSKILIDASTYQKFLATKEVRDTIGTFFGLSAAARNSGTAPLTQDRVNEYMNAAKLPTIEVVNVKIPIEKNGVPTIKNPWNTDNITFIPDGNLGEIKNAIAVEEQRPVDAVVYGKKDRTLISKWAQNEPFGEWTKAELNAFPSFDAINQINILKVDNLS